MDPCYHQKGGQLGVCILPEQTAWIERTVFAGELMVHACICCGSNLSLVE